jgi:hypothetical protein
MARPGRRERLVGRAGPEVRPAREGLRPPRARRGRAPGAPRGARQERTARSTAAASSPPSRPTRRGRRGPGRLRRVFNRFLRNGMSLDSTAEDRQILQSNFKSGQADPQNAAGVGTGSAGGYTVPPQFRDKIIETMKWYGPMLELAEVITPTPARTCPGRPTTTPATSGAILAENTQVSEQDVTLGTGQPRRVHVHLEARPRLLQLLQDRPTSTPGSPASSASGSAASSTALHRRHRHRQPDGIVTSATVGVTGTGSLAPRGASATTTWSTCRVARPGLRQRRRRQRRGARPEVDEHQSARKAVRKLKDSQNRPLWEPSLQAGSPDTLLGYPTPDQQRHGPRRRREVAPVRQHPRGLRRPDRQGLPRCGSPSGTPTSCRSASSASSAPTAPCRTPTPSRSSADHVHRLIRSARNTLGTRI